jgi:hypothetical protein
VVQHEPSAIRARAPRTRTVSAGTVDLERTPSPAGALEPFVRNGPCAGPRRPDRRQPHLPIFFAELSLHLSGAWENGTSFTFRGAWMEFYELVRL